MNSIFDISEILMNFSMLCFSILFALIMSIIIIIIILFILSGICYILLVCFQKICDYECDTENVNVENTDEYRELSEMV